MEKCYTVDDIAERLGKTREQVQHMLRERVFPRITVKNEKIGDRFITRHWYFDPTLWPAEYGSTDFHFISTDELANVWKHPDKEWEQPQGALVLIPEDAIKNWKRNYPGKVKRKSKGFAADVSDIRSDKWYGTAQAANFIGVSQRHLQNVLIPEEKLKAEKRGKSTHWTIKGEWIREYLLHGKTTVLAQLLK